MQTIIRTNNQVSLIGRVTRVKEFGKDVAGITMAIDNGRDKKGNDRPSTFIEFKCFAPTVYNNLKPGMLLMVTAHLNNNSYEKNGETIYSLDVVADCIEFLESKATVEAREAAKATA